MEVTEVRIKLMQDAGDRLQAFCSITFDNSFVVRDLKIIEGANGPFVAMPSRKLAARCPSCGCKNHLRAPFCNQCGSKLKEDRVLKDPSGRAKLYADIAHPINSRCREMVQDRILRAFFEEIDRSKQPGYSSSYDDYEFEDDFTLPDELEPRDSHGERPARSLEKTSVQQAEPQPRAPHLAPSGATAPRGAQPSEARSTVADPPAGAAPPAPHSGPADGKPSARFGAGILSDDRKS